MTPDIAIVGAGPAGLEAAIEARRHGASVLLLDEGMAPGGRIWQGLERRGAHSREEADALHVIERFRASGTDARFQATLWSIEGTTLFWSEGGRARTAEAGQVILATGTQERPLPIPGWTMPGVMTVGAAQILLKTGGLVPSGRTWIAGQGPLLLLYAVQALRAGGRLAGIIDLSASSLPVAHAFRALRSPGALGRGLAWRRLIAKAGVPWIQGYALGAHGEQKLERISFQTARDAAEQRADTLLLHDGVIPSVQLTRALGIAHEWNAAQACWQPIVDQWGQTNMPAIRVAGDGAGVGGWAAAALSGRLAALGALTELGRLQARDRDGLARPLAVRRRRRLALRPLLDALYPPLRLDPADPVVLCRCEEVTAGQVRQAVRLGCLGLNQLKAFTRAGMGPCQGRMCGPSVAQVVAAARGVPVEDVAPLRPRFPTKPLTLGELATLEV